MNRIEKLKIENQTVFFKTSETMQELKDNSIDLIITSPPYNRGKEYSSDFGEIHNDNLEEEEYYLFLERVWRECNRVAKQTAVFFLNIGDSAKDQGKSEKVVQSAVKAGWTRIQDIVWIKSFLGKGHYTPSGRNKRLNNIWEHIFLLVKNKKAYTLQPKAIGIPYADKSNIGRYSEIDLRDAGNVWFIPYQKTTGATIKKRHDAPFPIELALKCINVVPNVETALDPFGGLCSTLAACVGANVKGFAYERYPRINAIKERIMEGKAIKDEEVVLLPHMELTIEYLAKLIEGTGSAIEKITSKSQLTEYKIIFDVLDSLGIQNKLTELLENAIQQYKSTKEKK